MKALHKVVWAEGVFLGQQHFQLWDRYHEANQNLRARTVSPFAWGLIDIDVNAQALANGQLRLERCRAVFPDGRLVGYDAVSDHPLICDLAGAAADRVEVFLALPDNEGVEGIAGYQDKGRLCAWQAAYQEVPDAHDPVRVREVAVGRPNLSLIRGDEPRDQFAVLKIAELTHSGDGVFEPVPNFIPSVCHVDASQSLEAFLQRACDMIGAKVRVLSERRASYGGVADFGPSELGQFLLLQTLRPGLLALQHVQKQPELHPEVLYRELARLCAGLIGFNPEANVPEIPAYNHQDLSGVFAGFEAVLRALLSDVVPARMAGLKLHRESDALLVVEGVDSRQLNRSSFFLAVLHDNDDPTWVSDFARQIKVGAREDIELILSSALPGVRVVHTQRPPNRLPIKSGYEYFRLEPSGEFWNRVKDNQSLAMFLPRAFVKATVDLLTVDE